MCCNSRGALSRLGILWGLLALVTLLIAFVSGSWLYTKEPYALPNTKITTSISFRIGLWRVCPTIRKVNSSSIHVPSPACSLVKYSGWEDIDHTNLGLWTPIDLAQVFISRMRACTVLVGSSVILLVLAFFFALTGYCNSDNKSLIAIGLYILGALALGTGLVVFASELSETLMEVREYHKEYLSGPGYDYRYGWCFFTAGAAFIMTKMAAVFSLTGYLHRFTSVDDMVRQMVPGAERKLLEYQRHSSEFLVRHSSVPSSQEYEFMEVERTRYEPECGPLLNKTPPDVCTTNKCAETIDISVDSLVPVVSTEEHNFSTRNSFAGQTVPIKIKTSKHHSKPLSNFPCSKYGTMPAHPAAALHQGFLGVSELGSSSSNSSSSYCSRSKTLDQRPRKKCVKIETFQSPDTGFAEFSKRACTLGYSGSAV